MNNCARKFESPSTSKVAYLALKQLLLTEAKDPTLLSEFYKLFVILLTQIKHRRLEYAAKRHVWKFLCILTIEQQKIFLKGLLNKDKSLVALSVVIDRLEKYKHLNSVLGNEEQEFKKNVISKYIRECILPKEVIPDWTLKLISQNLLSHVIDEHDFSSLVLPACQKAMLRSPETSIMRVAFTMLGVSLDLSKFATDLGKLFATSLHSQDENSREHALFASKILSKKIQQPISLSALIEMYFRVFNGSEGKLTVAAQKMSILKAIGEMSNCGVEVADTSKIAVWIQDKCVKGMESEVHEGTVMEYLSSMSYWCSRLGDAVSRELLASIPKALLNMKSPVKTSFCGLLVNVFSPKRSQHLETVRETIQKSIEKMSIQMFQGSNLIDSVSLGLVLLNSRATGDMIPENVFNIVKTLPGHIDRKLVESSSMSSVGAIALLAQRLIEDYRDKMESINEAFDALALTLSAKSFETRKIPKQVVKSLVSKSNSLDMMKDIVHALERNINDVSDNIRMEILRFLAEASKSSIQGEELELLSIELIPLCLCSRRYYWLSVAQMMGLRPEKIVQKNWKPRLKNYLEDDNIPNRAEILEIFCFVHGEVVVECIVKEFKESMKQVDFSKVTRDEYFIFLTPEGQLYDNSLLESVEIDVMRNMKRESKAYSYTDQLEEIHLRKDLEKQRKAAGKEPKLSAKQKDVLKIQLEKEEMVRRNIQVMDLRLQSGFLLLKSALNGNIGALGFCIKDFISDIIELMGNPLSAPYAVKFYIELGLLLFPFHQPCGEAVCHVSLKLFNPKCDLSKEWQLLSLHSSLIAVLKRLCDIGRDNETFTAATYAYCFPLFKQSILTCSKYPEVTPAILDYTMSTLKSRVRGLDNSPEFIPRREVCKVLYHVVGTTEHRIQQIAVNVLLELAKSCGEPFGPDPESEELGIHLEALTSHLTVARDTALRCLTLGYTDLGRLSNEDIELLKASVFQASFDPVYEIAAFAKTLWTNGKFEHTFALHRPLLYGVLHPCLEVRSSAAKALGSLIESYVDDCSSVVSLLIQYYDDYLIMTPPVLDDFGRLLAEGIDNWEGRHGVGLGIRELAVSMSKEMAESTMSWVVSLTLLDRNSMVHLVMLNAALQIVEIHGKGCMETFATLIESHLDQRGDAASLDKVRQSCVVLMGCLARHIDPSDPRVKSIFSTLLDTLSTPSEKVQEAVANCLPALVPAVTAESTKIVECLIRNVMESEKYGERRGAAYGLAGMIKGLGILSLKQHDIMNILADGMQDKKNYRRREGSLMALELLCGSLGRLFEPYIVHVLPYLLQCLGDGNQYVREATENTARCVMSRLSGHGVKLVLPALLTALNEDSWRTKCGSVDLLGRMAYCAPKQLSGCLPMIVPHLIEVLGDSHVKVQDSAAKALSVIGSVIRNPEIQSVVPILLQALQDPAKKTSPCLQILLKTEFVHFVDSPSLALIMPVVERAFQDRSTENRRMASQIIGNMYSLTDHSDLAPYMNNVMPGIRASLLDPVPEVRAVAAKALGSMTRGMGEKCYDDLLPWLMRTLVSESNSVDRSGAAQGLAEVIGALGLDKLQRFMPEIIRKADSDDIAPHVRDGYMMMFIYMPSVFENDFVPYIGQIITPILKALADENEFVRETALRAGQRIVTGYADTAIMLLLPELQQGVFDDNWRIRYSSIQLLGDLLYKISGVSGKMSTESASDDDNFGTEDSQTLIIEKLGQERRNQILAGLYMGRSDVALMVRQAALHVWKVIVANTPKALREILSTLFSYILGFLANRSHDKRHVAARTLGDLVRKLGEKILPEIIPILEKGLESPKSEERQGVCIGLSEIMSSTSREMILAFVENLVPTLRKALCDPIVGVRAAAAQTFCSLHANVGSRALDEILPFMMKKLNHPDEGEYALDGLGQMLKTRSKAVMPYLIPQLISPPVNTKALSILSTVAGEALSKHLSKIFPVLLSKLNDIDGSPEFESELRNCEQILLSVEDEFGVRLILDELLDCCKNVGKGYRKPGIVLLSNFLAKTKVELKPHIGSLLRALILLMTDPDEAIIRATADAIPALLKHVPSVHQIDYIEDVRQAIRFARSDWKKKTELPGLSSPKAVKALLGIFREAILNASSEVKEQAAIGMGEVVVLSYPEAIKPSVVQVTGPLIRILGDRYSPEVKGAVLDTLSLLLPKVGTSLRSFLPQLQMTFQKAVNDDNRNVRTKAEFALTQLVFVQGIKQ